MNLNPKADADTLATRPEVIEIPPPDAAPSAAKAAAVFERHGLISTGLWSATPLPGDESRLDGSAAALCEALAELGGLYGAFARFLSWRADLLGGYYITHLRRVKLRYPSVSRANVAALIRAEFGVKADEVARSLSPSPLWNTLWRTAYLARMGSERIVFEVPHDPVSEEDFLAFEKGIRLLRRPEISAAVAPAVLLQFRDWFRNGESLSRRQSFLEVLGRHRSELLASYPVLITELCTSAILCWTAVEGRPISELIQHGSSSAAALIASAVLEQIFTLSMVDADLDLDAIIVDRDGRLHFRRLGNPLAILPGMVNTALKYVSAVLSGDAPRSAQTLVRLMVAKPPLDLEKELMEQFSAVEPELKINSWFPPSGGAFESNWRALARIAPIRPLFLDCLHRNLLTVAYWNADTVGSGAAVSDAIADGMWPVIGRVIRNEAGMLLTREAVGEWTVGSGLLLFSALREMNRIVEEVRESDITIGVDCSDWPRPRSGNGRILYQVILGCLLAFVLVSLQWGSAAPPPWGMVLKVLTVCALPAMFWAISQIG